MGKIIKSFQVKIDAANKVVVPTGQPMAKPVLETEEDIDPALFQALSPEMLAGEGRRVTLHPGVIDKSATRGATASQPDASPAGTAGIATDATQGPAQDAALGATPSGSDASNASFRSDADEPRLQKQAPQTWEELISKLKPDSKSAKLASLYTACKNRELELLALQDQLQHWEDDLRKRETAVTRQEEEAHQILLKKRQESDAEMDRILESARKSAASMISTSRAEAEAITKTARIQIDEAREAAVKDGMRIGEEKGFAKGEKEGLQEASFEWQSLMQETEMLIQELQTGRMALLKASEEEMVKLVLAFARSVIKTQVECREDIILNNLDAAINKVADVDKIVLRINLRDKTMCEVHKDNLLSRLGAVTELHIIEDSSLTPGGVKIETGVGTIDATIEAQTLELEQALRNYLRRQGRQATG